MQYIGTSRLGNHAIWMSTGFGQVFDRSDTKQARNRCQYWKSSQYVDSKRNADD